MVKTVITVTLNNSHQAGDQSQIKLTHMSVKSMESPAVKKSGSGGMRL